MNTARIDFNIIDQSFSQDVGIKGISGFMGVFLRGPVAKTDEIFSSWPQFKKVYGGLFAGSDAPLLVKRALARGTKLRICGVRHYTTIGDPSTITAIKAATAGGFSNSTPVELFDLPAKYPGSNYNNLQVTITVASNGDANAFDLRIDVLGEGDYAPEIYKNLKIIGSPTIAASDYLDAILQGSQLVDVVYKDLSALVGPIIPVPVVTPYASGSNGTTVNSTDYIGDSGAKNGLHAFDLASDLLAIGSDLNTSAMATGAAAYVMARKDLQYFHHFANTLLTPTQITTVKDALNIDTPYMEFWTGGLNVLDPLTNSRKDISAIGDILGAAALSEITYGGWYSFAASRRGYINDAFGVVNNFGSNSDLTSLDILANHQINAVVNVDGEMYLSGNFSAQRATSHLSFNSTVRLLISIKKALRPILKNYIEEPNDIPTWKEIYLVTHPIMENFKSKRAIFSYDWQGDQFATSLENLVINNPTDVGLGKYRVKLFVKDIVSLQDIGIDIIITPSGVSFEDSLTLLNAA